MEHKDAIVACFKNVGLSLAVDGSEDHMLKVRDCPNLTVGDWQKAPEGTAENPAIIDEDGEDIIEVDDNTNIRRRRFLLEKAGSERARLAARGRKSGPCFLMKKQAAPTPFIPPFTTASASL